LDNDGSGCRCRQIATELPLYAPDDDDDDLGCYLPPGYAAEEDIGGGAATVGRSKAAGHDPADVEMCGVAVLCPPTPGVCIPASSYFAATPRPAPTITPLPRFGPDPSDSAVAFDIRFGCRPRDFTVAYGVARGLSEDEARVVERIAVDLEFGPQPDSSPSAAAE
jgi:hypothetical protein